jgi:hypothetical protein
MVWYSQIIDDGKDVPLFSVAASGDETATFTGSTPTAPWARALKEIATRFNWKGRAVSGPEACLLSSPVVTVLIERLPGANECTQYQMKNLKDIKGKRSYHKGGSTRGRSVDSDEDEDEETESSTSVDEDDEPD